jgi:uncharacterized membrane protein
VFVTAPASRPGIAHGIVWALFAAHLLAQPVYALLPRDLELLGTLFIVVTSTSFAFAHLWVTGGARAALMLLALCFFVAGGFEILSVHTGFPYGHYAYSSLLGPGIAGVPFIVPLCWQMMAHNAGTVARLLNPKAFVLVASGALVAWDVYLDPQMVRAGLWTWERSSGPWTYAGIPLENYAGWFLTALVIYAAYSRLVKPRALERPTLFEALPALSFVWTWFGSGLVNIVWWGQPLVGAAGLILMGAFAVPVALKLWRVTRGQS